jgi:hypothetical protein
MRDIALSLPAVVGALGAADVLEPEMSTQEREAFGALRRSVASGGRRPQSRFGNQVTDPAF